MSDHRTKLHGLSGGRPKEKRHVWYVLVLAAACSSSPSEPSAAEVQAFTALTNLIAAESTIDQAHGWVWVDTGNPFGQLDGGVFPSVSALPDTGGNLAIEVSGITTGSAFVTNDPFGDILVDPAFPISGVIGCSVLCGHATSFDYRDAKLTLDGVTVPTGVDADVMIDFTLEGGGDHTGGVTLPPTRVVVTVTLEGTDYRMLLDTGASLVTVSANAFSALTAGGRATANLPDLSFLLGGSTPYVEARAASVVVGGLEVDDVVVAHAAAFDDKLTELSTDVGEQIDGSLGGTFLHDFYVTIDYPNHQIHLARYTDLGFAIDPAHAVALQLVRNPDDTYAVAAVSGDAAAQGVAVGDHVTAIAGHDVGSLGVYPTYAALYGPVGSTKMITFGDRTVPILVEELLPR